MEKTIKITRTLKKDDIKNLIKRLSRSQGFYGRLYQALDEKSYKKLESMNFESEIDVILFFEQ